MTNLKFSVAAGKYETTDGATEENCKFCDSFETLEEAIASFEENKSYPWCRIELRDGDFIYEIEPTRIQRKVPGTDRFEKCDFDGQQFIEDRTNDEPEEESQPEEKPFSAPQHWTDEQNAEQAEKENRETDEIIERFNDASLCGDVARRLLAKLPDALFVELCRINAIEPRIIALSELAAFSPLRLHKDLRIARSNIAD